MLCFSFALSHSAGKMPGISVIQVKRQCNIKHKRLQGNTAMDLPIGYPRSVGLSVGNSMDGKSVPAIPWIYGAW